MKFINPLPFVTDMERSKAFYRDVMCLKIIEDHGNFVRFENGFALHEGRSLLQTVFSRNPEVNEPHGRYNLVLYFEDPDIWSSFDRIAPHVELIHAIERQTWGQRVFRFHDPDRHILEVGEPT
ncbi:VOC family protein [uncultured Roseibium sp.]|uniref:VOC family protein n=1 Tax=uncultured Roseibium sp. TaxID=1936171 RepID=UPI00260474A9|nr:VOC family protein [uncultured Roseibium sp.]